jgi:hypothetical protein
VRAPGRLRGLTRTTPGRYRLWSLVATAVLLAATAVGTFVAVHMGTVTERTRRNTGPVLVATQGLVASLAEADAAATATFLSGRAEDREQRRLYEQALARSHQQIEDIAALAGDTPVVHEALGTLLVDLSRYAGLVEAARANLRGGVPGAEAPLVEAIGVLAKSVEREIGTITAEMQARFDAAQRDRSTGVNLARGVAVAALVVLLVAQAVLAGRTRRLLSPPLVVATLATLAAVAWLTSVDSRAAGDIEDARRNGYESIVVTARLQAVGHRTKTDEALAVVTGSTGLRTEADRVALQVASPTGGGLLQEAATRADTPREQAAARELSIRWDRYRNAVRQLRAAPTVEAARAVSVGPLSSAFNGFNYSVESVLADNRDQFVRGLADADDARRGLSLGMFLLPLLAAAAVLVGFQVRINEYR